MRIKTTLCLSGGLASVEVDCRRRRRDRRPHPEEPEASAVKTDGAQKRFKHRRSDRQCTNKDGLPALIDAHHLGLLRRPDSAQTSDKKSC